MTELHIMCLLFLLLILIFIESSSSFLTKPALTSRISLSLSSSTNNSYDNNNCNSLENYQSLFQWIKSNPQSYIHPSIQIRPSPRGGYGAFASTSIPKEDLLFRIPRETCITATNVLTDPDIGDAAKNLMKKAGPGGFTVALAAFVAKERLLFLEEGNSESVGFSNKGTFGPYLQTLPFARGYNGQDHILFWSKDEIESLLRGTMCYNEAVGLRTEVGRAAKIIDALLSPTILKARGEEDESLSDNNKNNPPLIPFLEWTRPPPPPSKRDGTLLPGMREAVKGSFVCLLTRSFEDTYDTIVSTEDAECLIPLLDMLNHDNEPSVRYSTNKDDGSVEVRARRDIGDDEEIYNRYREEEEMNMPYHRFFTRFGFVPGVDGDARALLEQKSSIFYPQKAEV